MPSNLKSNKTQPENDCRHFPHLLQCITTCKPADAPYSHLQAWTSKVAQRYRHFVEIMLSSLSTYLLHSGQTAVRLLSVDALDSWDHHHFYLYFGWMKVPTRQLHHQSLKEDSIKHEVCPFGLIGVVVCMHKTLNLRCWQRNKAAVSPKPEAPTRVPLWRSRSEPSKIKTCDCESKCRIYKMNTAAEASSLSRRLTFSNYLRSCNDTTETRGLSYENCTAYTRSLW